MDRRAWRAAVHGVTKVGHNWTTKHSTAQKLGSTYCGKYINILPSNHDYKLTVPVQVLHISHFQYIITYEENHDLLSHVIWLHGDNCYPRKNLPIFLICFFPFIFISWGLITLQCCSGFCHTLTWISHRFTCVPYPDPPSHLPLHPIPLVLPSAPALSTCLMHPTWAGDLFHPW